MPLKQSIVDYPNVLLVRRENLSNDRRQWDVIRDFLECERWGAGLLENLVTKPSWTSRNVVYSAAERNRSDRLPDTDVAQITRIITVYGLEKLISS